MSSLREVEMLVEDLVSAYDATLEVGEDEILGTMTESETARFIHDWAERLRAAVLSDVRGVIRPPPLPLDGGVESVRG